MNPATPKTEQPPSAQLQNVVFGSSHLFQPLTIKSVTLRNRIGVSPKRNKMKDKNTWNTICPVYGSPIRPEMALVELAPVSEGHQHPDHAQRGIRLCSKECAETAERSPQKYQAAAAANRVAGE